MTDEKDPRLMENGLESEDENSQSSVRNERVPRTPSGRFPAIPQGRAGAGGRFSQTGMPVVPRAGAAPDPGASQLPNMPTAPGARGRGGRPGIVGARGARPVIHTQEAPVEYGHETENMSQHEVGDVPENVPVDDAMAALDDVFGGSSWSSAANVSVSVGSADQGAASNESLEANAESSEIPLDMSSQAPWMQSDAQNIGEELRNSNSGVQRVSGVQSVSGVQRVSREAAAEVMADSHEEQAVESEMSESDATPVPVVESAPVAEPGFEEAGHEHLLMTEVPVAAPVQEVAEPADGYENDDEIAEEHAGPAFEIKPIPPELRQEASLRDNSAYRKESRSLLRTQNWTELVLLMQNVLTYAVWADLPEVRSSILKELAGIYLEKLEDADKAKQTYQQLLRESPSNESALEFMESEYRKDSNFKAIHDMYRRVVDVTWDCDERICYTRKAAEIAVKELSQPSLAIADWEHLWSIGETGEEVQNSLMTVYREHECWDKLANFVRERCVDWNNLQRLGLREVVEIYISGLGDAQRARESLNALLKDRPNDPLLLLQDINVCRIGGDIDKLAAISRVQGLEKNVEIDIHRAAAEVLWDKGERELAVQAYDTILGELPNDRDALHVKEMYFSEGGYHEQLCGFYEMRAERAIEQNDMASAISYLEKAADVSEKMLFDNERAISILKRVVELEPNAPDHHRRIIELYEALGDDAGVAASMENLLSLTSRPALRGELLSKLGRLYLEKLENYEKAEDCWKKVQTINPRDPEVSEELSRVYAKQGDFDSLDKSLTRQIRVADDSTILQLAESKGRYLMQHNPESAHTAASFEIVLDNAPHHVDACENLSQVLDKLHRNDEMMGILEQELASIADKDERVSLGLRIADSCVDSATHAQAVAAYLRVLRWEPTQQSALTALESICSEQERSIVQAVLEIAAIHSEDISRRCELLRTSLRFIAPENVVQRIQLMRRILILGDRNIEPEFVELCRSSHHSELLCAAWMRRACETDDVAVREKLLFDVARISAEDLDNASIAFTILFSAALDSSKAVALAEELEILAPQTNRWEEVVAVLNCLTSKLFDDEQRRKAIEKRIDILLNKLNDPARALDDYARLLSMDPDDAQVLEAIEKLAAEKNLHEQLLGIYGELWDVTANASLRSDIAHKRHNIAKDVLSRQEMALCELFIGYRLVPSTELEDSLTAECADSAKAALCVTLLESEKMSADDIQVADIKAVASIYEKNLSNVDGAFSLYSKALINAPADEESLQKLESWSANESHRGRYAQTLRLAASEAHASDDDETSLNLYRKLALFYKNVLNDLERSVDVERTILHIKPDCVESLESMIAWHESRQEWPELRSELKQRILAGGSDEDKISLWLRIVNISSEHLNDIEGTFDGYAEILQIDESNEAAHEGITQLTGADIGPDVELRRLRLELKLAETEKRPDIMLAIAKLQKDELSLPDAACDTLEALYKETGPCGVGYEPLYHSYESMKAWKSMVQIMIEHANKLVEDQDDDSAIMTLSQALQILDKHVNDKDLIASVVEKLQSLDPDNEEIIDRYFSSLRMTENWEKYTETLQSHIDQFEKGKSGRKSLLFELARIKALAFNNLDDALSLYREVNRSGGVERNAYFGMASIALKKGDIDLYLSSLDQVLRLLDPAWGAIFYCHMAEVCDEKGKTPQVATYYRSARSLDPENAIASDSLRSIGRRLKNWRSTSAILPVDNERELSWTQRSDMLLELANKASSTDEARQWLWKAIAVSHDNADAWRALAKLEQKAGNLKACYEACFSAYGTVERTTLPGPAGAFQNAQLLFEVSQAATACGSDAKGEILLRRAYSLAPKYAPVAVAVGELEQDSGNIDKAYAIYDAILNDKDIVLDDKLKSELLFKRGLIANILQNYEQALDDLRATVKMSPLHYEALMTISKTYTDMNQPLFALAALQQGLIVTDNKTKRRGNIYYDMGKIWGDNFNDHDEAGIYYEGALDNGASNVDLIERCLEIYKRAGRYHEALELADSLTKTTTNPAILASLWCTKGELSESISPEQATEAYDMALSYAPGIARAFDGLERMLVARGEWAQLADLLNGRLEGEHTKEQEADILLRLADIYSNQLDEKHKAINILYRLLDEVPSAGVVDRLLAMPQDDQDKCRALYEKAIIYCNGSYEYALRLAENHLMSGRELQAWAIMSPLRALLQLDPQVKEILNDLKNKFEKTDSVSLDSLIKALPVLTDEQFAILDALKMLEQKIQFGPKKLDDVTSGASEVSENTPNGKIFQQMRQGLGLENIALYRSAELPEAIVIINAEPIVVCIRTEIFQKAAGNELQFWLAKAVGMAHPDMRYIASTPEYIRPLLPKALLAAVGIGSITPAIADIVSKIKAALSTDELKDVKAQLTLYSDQQLLTCAEHFSQDIMQSTDLIGAYVVADMRTVWRAESRIDSNITEQRNVKTVEEIGKTFDSAAVLRKVLAYYVSDTFTEHLAQ